MRNLSSTTAWVAILVSIGCSVPLIGQTLTAWASVGTQDAGRPTLTNQKLAQQFTSEDFIPMVQDSVAQRRKNLTTEYWVDPARVAGHDKCVECHQNEIRAWRASAHSTRAFELLRTSDVALEYARELRIAPADITKSSICVTCHGTAQLRANQTINVIPGVSCEACHNGAGGENGWLNVHPVYGPTGTRREQETPDHFAYRRQRCGESGQLGSSSLYGLTKRCFQCHVNGDESLAIAGHDHGDGFEMVAKSLGEVRHNFVLNESENSRISTLWSEPFLHGRTRTVAGRLRVMFVLGQMVDLETSFRNLAKATAENEFSDASIERIENAIETLAEDILEEIEAERLKPQQRAGLQEIQAVVEIAQPHWEALDDEGFDVTALTQYENAAESIAVLARRFALRTGNHLAFLDELDLLPEDFFDGAFDPRNPDSTQSQH